MILFCFLNGCWVCIPNLLVFVFSTSDWYLELNPFITKVEDWVFSFDESYRKLIDQFKVKSLKGFGCENLQHGIISAGAILYHITESLNGSIDHISKIQPILIDDILNLFTNEPELIKINQHIPKDEGMLKSLKRDEEFQNLIDKNEK